LLGLKNIILSSNLFKNKDFFKILETNDFLNYLEKLVEQHFSKTLFDASENAKNTFFCDVTKVENFDKKCLNLSKENQKSPFKQICFGRSKSPVKGLICTLDPDQRWTGHCGNCSVAFYFENARLFLRLRGILKIFSVNFRLF
jgi:hypothetical protein